MLPLPSARRTPSPSLPAARVATVLARAKGKFQEPIVSPQRLKACLDDFTQQWSGGPTWVTVVVNASNRPVTFSSPRRGVPAAVCLSANNPLSPGGNGVKVAWQQSLAAVRMDNENMCQWLASLHPDMTQYVDEFKANGFESLDLLRLVTKEDFGALNIRAGHRHVLWAAIQQLQADASKTVAHGTTSDDDADRKEDDSSAASPKASWNAQSVGVHLLPPLSSLTCTACEVQWGTRRTARAAGSVRATLPAKPTVKCKRGFVVGEQVYQRGVGGANVLVLMVEDSPYFMVDVYENQRWTPFDGWTSTLSVSDPCTWSNEDGLEMTPRHQYRLPKLWKWASDWCVDFAPCMHLDNPDPSGWVYASAFPGGRPVSSTGASSAMSMLSFVRSRRWLRASVRRDSAEVKDNAADPPVSAKGSSSSSQSQRNQLARHLAPVDDFELNLEDELSPVPSPHKAASPTPLIAMAPQPVVSSMESMRVVKLVYGSQVHRLRVPSSQELTYELLVSHVKSVYPTLHGHFQLVFQESDSERWPVNCDEDVQTAVGKKGNSGRGLRRRQSLRFCVVDGDVDTKTALQRSDPPAAASSAAPPTLDTQQPLRASSIPGVANHPTAVTTTDDKADHDEDDDGFVDVGFPGADVLDQYVRWEHHDNQTTQ